MISKLSENREDQLTEAEPPRAQSLWPNLHKVYFLFKLLNYKNHFRTHQV